MPQRDMTSDLSAVELIAPAVIAADNTPASIDLKGFEGCAIYLHIGAGGITFTSSNKIEYVLTHSDDDSTYANVVAADLVGAPTVTNGIIKSLTAAHASPSISEFGYKGGKRYLKLLADFGGTHATGTAMSAIAVRGFPLSGPVA